MERAIVGYAKDEQDEWVAVLDCHHLQHVRHKPPFTNRPWVVTEAGREEKIGMMLNCTRCDRLEFPQGLEAYKRTPEFNEQSVPAGLLKNHSTKTGTWGLIEVVEGRLMYTVQGSEGVVLDAGRKGVVAPNVLHQVSPLGHVRFSVEFWRKRLST